jgi:transposase-like protein
MENNQINNYVGKKGVHIPQDVKDYILKKIKEGAKSVPEISKEHGVSKSAIYKMLRNETSGSADPQLLRLQKENSLLKQLVAELSLKVRENEKKGW